MTDVVDELARIRALAEGATEGPWYWRNTGDPYLMGKWSQVVMAFERMGMQGAQPSFRDEHGFLVPAGRVNLNAIPDAAFIADARTTVPRLVAALEAVLALAHEWHARFSDCDEADEIRAAITTALTTEGDANA